MRYRVILSPAAERQLDRTSGVTRVALRGLILGLRDEPRPAGSLKLAGLRNVWRLRARIDGRPWRIVYRLDASRHEIVIARVVARGPGQTSSR